MSLTGTECSLVEIKLGWKWAPCVTVMDRSCKDVCHSWLCVTSCEVGRRPEEGKGRLG